MNRIGSLISPFVRSLGIEGALRLAEIRREWAALFGEPLSLHMSPASMRNDELLINVDSPVWLQQISFYKTDIVKKLSRFRIAGVRFRLGKIRPEKGVATNQHSVLTKKNLDAVTMQYIEQTVSAIRDDEIKESVRKAMEKSFSHKIRTR